MTYRRILLGLIALVFWHELLAALRWAITIMLDLATSAALESLAVGLLAVASTAGLIWTVVQGLRALTRRVPKRGH